MPPELWMQTISHAKYTVRVAKRAEVDGWAGITVVDSQNMAGDSYVALALAAAATTRLKLGTGVTNPVTRHPAVTASAIASIQEASEGRAVLGIGRGDSALAHLGRAPASVAAFERYLKHVQMYLRGDGIEFAALESDGITAPALDELGLADAPDQSRLLWLGKDPDKVPVEVAATGPKVIAAAARHADRILFALGADEDRIAWGIEQARAARKQAGLVESEIEFGAFINLVCHPDIEIGNRLVRGGLATFARFSVMHGHTAGPVTPDQQAVLEELNRKYNMRRHTRADSDHAAVLTPEFIERFAIVGPPEHCIERLQSIARLGIDKIIIVGATAGADRNEVGHAAQLLAREVLPGFQQK